MKSKHQKRKEALERLKKSIEIQENQVDIWKMSQLKTVPAWDPEATPWIKSYSEWVTAVKASREANLKLALKHLHRMREEALNLSVKLGAAA